MEEFRDIINYPDYQISNLGRVKSFKGSKERILKPRANNKGYLLVGLRKNPNRKTIAIHKLVAIEFLNHIPCGLKYVVDHIDNNKLNNNLSNLQIITNRENCCKDLKKGKSKYVGVSWDKSRNKWKSEIRVNGEYKYLGRFDCELQASSAYQVALKDFVNESYKGLKHYQKVHFIKN
tara:strand:+ start:276 stop:806 length:531 start_codon:yes stop_codon:yes gene_type:complete